MVTSWFVPMLGQKMFYTPEELHLTVLLKKQVAIVIILTYGIHPSVARVLLISVVFARELLYEQLQLEQLRKPFKQLRMLVDLSISPVNLFLVMSYVLTMSIMQ